MDQLSAAQRGDIFLVSTATALASTAAFIGMFSLITLILFWQLAFDLGAYN